MPPESESFIIFSHGFGVEKTDRGLFNDILAGLEGVIGVMFNYNQVEEGSGKITVRPLSEQAESLAAVIATVRNRSEEPIDLICHSQGCVVAGMVQPKGIRRVIMLNPPFELSSKRSSENWAKIRDSKVNLTGDSLLNRADGSVTTVPKDYWPELDEIDPVASYIELAGRTELTLMTANQDEVVSNQPEGLDQDIKLVRLDGDHNFSGTSRLALIAQIQELLAS